MKIWITVLCAVALLVGCTGRKDAGVNAPQAVDGDELEERDGLWYFEEQPFTGDAVRKYPNGQKKRETTWKDGKGHGLYTFWYENGQKWAETTWEDGKLHGLAIWWHFNGQKHGEETYKDGKRISQKKWDKDGNPK